MPAGFPSRDCPDGLYSRAGRGEAGPVGPRQHQSSAKQCGDSRKEQREGKLHPGKPEGGNQGNQIPETSETQHPGQMRLHLICLIQGNTGTQ